MKFETPKNADDFFEKMQEWYFVESEMDEFIFETLNCPDENDYWFFDDISYDYYDYSFELLKVDPSWEPDEEGLKKVFEFGFFRCWINYTDGSEIYCYYSKEKELHIGKRKYK